MTSPNSQSQRRGVLELTAGQAERKKKKKGSNYSVVREPRARGTRNSAYGWMRVVVGVIVIKLTSEGYGWGRLAGKSRLRADGNGSAV